MTGMPVSSRRAARAAFGSRMRGAQPALGHERGQVSAVARDRQDPRRTGRQSTVDEIRDEGVRVRRHRRRRQGRGRVGILRLVRAGIDELREAAGAAHAEPQRQPGLRRVIGVRKPATRRLRAEVERQNQRAHRTLDTAVDRRLPLTASGQRHRTDRSCRTAHRERRAVHGWAGLMHRLIIARG